MKYFLILALAFVIYMANALFLAFFYEVITWMTNLTWVLDFLWQIFLPLYVGLESKYKQVKKICYYWVIFAVCRFFYTILTQILDLPLVSDYYSYIFLQIVFGVTIIYYIYSSFLRIKK